MLLSKSHSFNLIALAPIFLNNFISSVHAETPSGRTNLGCALLSDRIYCYGGGEYSTATVTAISSNYFYSLNVSENMSLDQMRSAWEPIDIPSGQLDPGPNVHFASAALPELNTLFVDGGWGPGDHTSSELIKYRSVMFNASTNAWEEVSDGDYTTVSHHCAVTDAQNQIQITGGVNDQSVNATAGLETIFPHEVIELDVVFSSWFIRRFDDAIPARASAAAVLGKDRRSIYYIGGYTNDSQLVSMTEIPIYDSVNREWSASNGTSSTTDVPSPRMWHTVTLHPTTGEILLFGGTGKGENTVPITNDNIYLFNTDTMTWKRQPINKPSGLNGPGTLYGHQAILIDNSTLAFLFGTNGEGTATNDIHLLNIDSYTWVDHITGTNPKKPGDGTDNDDDSDKPLPGGAIAGIVVGVVILVLLIVGAIVFFIMRRRKRNRSGQSPHEKDDYESDNAIIGGHDKNTKKSNDLFLDTLPENSDAKLSINVVSEYSSTGRSSTVALRPDGAGPHQAVKPDASMLHKPENK
ncbi:hypothetical protein BDA99DRAFT_601803 [Phascolomyces articulosus]|uniref:Galactose oxidase n=1 Tax=Phascolomyces articulosus TaxID=60185 RepID=A0AAD5K8Q5_9FUNG|nr:hypothetical protein BDA99DRAFT_601803 [Phascolomyces articulosus]